MESMNTRRNRKHAMPVGNHEPYWMSHVARISQSTTIWLQVRDMAGVVRRNADEGDEAWGMLEKHLRVLSRQLAEKLRDNTSPRMFRNLEDVNELVNRPEILSGDPRCWALLGSIEAVTTMLGAMHVSRVIYAGDIRAAAKYLHGQLQIYQAKVIAAYDDIRSLMVTLCEDARPKTVELVIRETDSGPVLMVQYEVDPAREVE